jgi:hypothetical protein
MKRAQFLSLAIVQRLQQLLDRIEFVVVLPDEETKQTHLHGM